MANFLHFKGVKESLRLRTRLRKSLEYALSYPLRPRTERQKQSVLRDRELKTDERALLGAVESRISPKDTMYSRDGRHYFRVGLSALRVIEGALDAAGNPAVKSVLDLPCGHGRVLRFLVHRFPQASFTACDLDRDGVDFCGQKFKTKAIYSKPELNDLDLRTQFDLIWCGSLITHLEESKISNLLKFFRKHLTQDGLLVFSTHGDRVLERMLGPEPRYGIPKESASAIISSYQERGFGYKDYPDTPGYGVTLTSPDWIRAQLSQIGGFKEVYFKAHGWDDHQDVFGIVRTTDEG